MGEAHVNLTEAYLSAIDGQIGVKHLIMSDFPTIGFQTTYAENRYITGSAASGTALATGHKTTIGTISMAGNHTDTLFSIAYFAHQAGMKVGILTSVGINHATPSVFYAHQPDRGEYYEIALQLPKSDFDVFGGGGFINPTGNKAGTMTDAYEITAKKGYKITRTKDDFNELKAGDKKVLMVSPDIMNQGEMPYSIDQEAGMLTLADFTQKAIDLLDNPNGFFLMVEGGKIDWASHANDAATVVKEVIDFDNAIKKAVDFYKKHPDETIIIVTADHETGGLALGTNSMHYDTDFAILKNQKGSIDALNAIFSDFIKQNTLKELTFEKVLELGQDFFGIDKNTLTKKETDKLQNSYDNFLKKQTNENLTYGKANEIATTWLEIFDTRAGIGWTSHSHTGIPVPVRVMGINHGNFDGFYDNTDISKKLAEIMKIKFVK